MSGDGAREGAPAPELDLAAVAGRLAERFPRRDPLTVRLPDLERWVRELDPLVPAAALTPAVLESIQAAWYARRRPE